MCPIPWAASASARGGYEDGRGAEVGGGDACLEMMKVRRGCIVYDGSVLLMGAGVGPRE